jgi:uncharacterized SAM-binding protein YcdF (DUF218 family)
MFVFLSKFLPGFVYPVGLVCILLIAALIVRKRPGWHTGLIVAALVILFLGGNRWVAMSLKRSLEWQYLPPAEIPKAEVIVLLGGGTEAADYPRQMVEVNGAGDRVFYAAQLYKQGKAPYILLSGGNITWSGNHTSTPAEDMAELLKMLGVPESALWLQTKSQNTHEDAQYSKAILDENHIHRILLVTSASHMPRAVGLFKKQGLEVIPLPTDYDVTQTAWENLFAGSIWDKLVGFWPSIGNLSDTTSVLKEHFGLVVYRLRGWL